MIITMRFVGLKHQLISRPRPSNSLFRGTLEPVTNVRECYMMTYLLVFAGDGPYET